MSERERDIQRGRKEYREKERGTDKATMRPKMKKERGRWNNLLRKNTDKKHTEN